MIQAGLNHNRQSILLNEGVNIFKWAGKSFVFLILLALAKQTGSYLFT